MNMAFKIRFSYRQDYNFWPGISIIEKFREGSEKFANEASERKKIVFIFFKKISIKLI